MITAVEGIRVGHWTDPIGMTGCTVVLPPPGTIGSGEVRGGAPGTRETDLLRPGMLVEEVHGVLLAGGSAFGLAAADGVMRFLEERGIGFDAGIARVPIVPAAVLFDLGVGDPAARPDSESGYKACVAAGRMVDEGRVGAGTGATVAKLHGPDRAVPGGIGTASMAEDGVTVGSLVAVNAFGEIVDGDGELLPSDRGVARSAEEHPPRPRRAIPPNPPRGSSSAGKNTTIGVVATDARLSRDQAHALAGAAHDGLDRAVRPAHTMVDGDTVFTLATGTVDATPAVVERLAVETFAAAIRRAVDQGRR